MTLEIKGCFVEIDSEDFALVSKHKWHLDSYGYAITTQWCKINKKTGKRFKMHRLVMGDLKGTVVDHINGNRLDNRKSNLRLVTRSQQMWNKSISKNNVSGFKGVCLDKRRGTWKAEICKNRKKFYLGNFKTPEEAYKVYINAAKELHGEHRVKQLSRLTATKTRDSCL